jgi:HlyD family secretion protein
LIGDRQRRSADNGEIPTMTWKHIVPAALVVAAVAAALGFFWPFGNNKTTLRLPGVVETQEIRLGSKVGGRVAEIGAMEGDLVQPSQILVRFEAPELEAQLAQAKAKLAAAEAELDETVNGARPEEKEAAQAAVEVAKARWERLKAGWREEEKRQARSELDSAEAELNLAREEFQRVERLYRQGSATRAEWDTARATRDRAVGRAEAARARADMLTAGSRAEDIAEAVAEMRRLQAQYELVLAGSRVEDIAQAKARVVEAAARVRELEANLQEALVRAPEAVVVEVLGVRKGDIVAPNQPVVRVLRADDLWVRVYVPETELGKVRVGQEVRVTIDSYQKEFPGTIIQINSISEFTPRNVQSADERRHQVFGVKVRVEQPADPSQRVFKSGMAAEVTVPLQEAP